MKKNIGIADKNVRRLLVIALILAAYFGPGHFVQITKQVQTYLLVAAAVLFVTTLINWCPIWAVLRVNTSGKMASKKSKKTSKKRRK
jgi:Na+-translocating ferredoxin:NAD+ oxidoreductase RnfA subunit